MSVKVSAEVISEAGKPVNCRICGGEIVPFLSPAPFAAGLPAGIIFAGYARGVNRFFVSDGHDVYASGNGITYSRLHMLEGTPFMVEDIYGGVARAAVISGRYAVTHDGGSFTSFEYGANLSCGVMHCGRLFGADADDGLVLRWSGEGGLTDWAQGLHAGGYLKLDPECGVILDVLEYGGKLAVIRKYGITLLSMYGNAENFAVEFTLRDLSEIYKNTARVAGDGLYMFTASGLKCFDGSRLTEIKHAYAGDIVSPACAAAWDNKYFLSCANGVFCYDGERGTLIDVKADAMCSADRVYVFNSAGAYALAGGGEYSFTSERFFFGTERRKTVTRLFVNGLADVEISNGRISRAFAGVSGVIRPRLRGESFTFRVGGSAPVKSIIATAELENEI